MSELICKLLRENYAYDPVTGVMLFTTGKRKGRRAGSEQHRNRGTRYRRLKIAGRLVYEHRAAWYLHHGEWVRMLDHENGDGTDNRIANLTPTTHQLNARKAKRAKTNTTGHKGVSREGTKWRAYLKLNNKQIYLGKFNTYEQACAARKAGELKYWV